MSPSLDPTSRLRSVPLHDPSRLAERVLAEPDAARPRFSAVADLSAGLAVGYEGLLSVGDDGTRSPAHWGARVHPTQAGAVEAALTAVLLAEREQLPAGARLMVNVSAAALRAAELRATLEAATPLDGVVLLITKDAAADDARGASLLEAVRDGGGEIAVDETGSGYASLRHVLDLRPDFVRISRAFVDGVDSDDAKAAVVEAVASLAARTGARVIADGIPGRPELLALRRMGVPLGQGPLFGRPTAVTAPLAPALTEAIRSATPPVEPGETVAGLVEPRAPLAWASPIDAVADAFLADPQNDVLVLVDERSRPLALAERAALLRGEPHERPVMRVSPSSPLKSVARRAAARPWLERFHPLVACDRRGVYLGLVRVERLLEALGRA